MSTWTGLPNSSDTYNQDWFIFGGGSGSASSNNHTYIDEETLDEGDGLGSDSDYTDIYGFPNHTTESGTINSVTVKVKADSTWAGACSAGSIYLLLKIGGTIYSSAVKTLTSSVAEYSETWANNPATSSAWGSDWSVIDALLAGDRLIGNYGDGGKSFCNSYSYKVWLEVDYASPPDAPTGVSATDNLSDKVTITWTKSTGATGYRVYRDGSDISGLLGDVATYDDTTAAAPVITAGNAAASDGAYTSYVALSLSGNSIADGTSYTYTVKAYNAAGLSAASSGDTGYRKAASVTYQWKRSDSDADINYSDISGGTTATYNDTGAPADGSGRYFKCTQSASGSSSVTSAINRGYRAIEAGSYFLRNIARTKRIP